MNRLDQLLTVLLSLAAIPIYLTGEPAEQPLENQPWFDKQRVEVHEQPAEAGLIAVLATGAVALGGLWLDGRGRPQHRGVTIFVLLGLVVSAVLFALAACDGGQIRHDEIRPTAAARRPADSTTT